MNTSPLYEELSLRKVKIEERLNELNEVLVNEGNVGLTGELIDKEGYPRADIDIYKVRYTRQEINRLRNDYNALLKEIEKELVSIHSKFRPQSEELSEKTIPLSNSELVHHKPFAKITQVDSDSPASEAGLKVDDEIIQFGPYTHLNTKKNLSEIAELVKNSANKIVLLKVSRSNNGNDNSIQEHKNNNNNNNKKLEIIKLVPKQWKGHGLLGCKIVPID